jgi:hypothetical protein
LSGQPAGSALPGRVRDARRAAAPASEYVARTLADDVVVRGAVVSVCLGRPGRRLAGHRWLGQGFQQRPDLGIGVASMAAQGPEVGQPPLLGPATHRLWGHMKELGDLRCPEVPRLGWLWHRMLHSRRVSLRWGTTLRPWGANAIQRSTHSRPAAGLTACQPADHDASCRAPASSPARGAPPSRSGCA